MGSGLVRSAAGSPDGVESGRGKPPCIACRGVAEPVTADRGAKAGASVAGGMRPGSEVGETRDTPLDGVASASRGSWLGAANNGCQLVPSRDRPGAPGA